MVLRSAGKKNFRQEAARILDESYGRGRLWEIRKKKKKKSSQFNDLGGVLQGASLESGL